AAAWLPTKVQRERLASAISPPRLRCRQPPPEPPATLSRNTLSSTLPEPLSKASPPPSSAATLSSKLQLIQLPSSAPPPEPSAVLPESRQPVACTSAPATPPPPSPGPSWWLSLMVQSVSVAASAAYTPPPCASGLVGRPAELPVTVHCCSTSFAFEA